MSDELQQQHYPGHYSGKNKIPTVGKFLESLDKDKKQRDQQIDQQNRPTKHAPNDSSDAKPHVEQKAGIKGTQKEVTDPTTGRQVIIEDVNKEMMKNVENPMVSTAQNLTEHLTDLSELSVPNANIGKDTPVKTEASQSNPEYAHNQDITAPPDPVAEGTTSDVPIHGEKTNILFHPTPSVSYEPTFAALEKKTGGLCIGVFVAIVVVGKLFNGRLLGLIPLAMCVTSGIWLWMKEVVRSGREVEWESEKERGETVSFIALPPQLQS